METKINKITTRADTTTKTIIKQSRIRRDLPWLGGVYHLGVQKIAFLFLCHFHVVREEEFPLVQEAYQVEKRLMSTTQTTTLKNPHKF